MSDITESEAGSVIIHQSQATSFSGRATPAKTTVMIPVDFDAHFADTGEMVDESTPLLTMETTHEVSAQDDRDAVAGAEAEIEQEHLALPAESRRQTVNFNEFFDVAALAAPTAALNLGEEIAQPPAFDANSTSPGSVEMSAVRDIELGDPVHTIQGHPVCKFHEGHPTTIVDLDDMEVEASATISSSALCPANHRF